MKKEKNHQAVINENEEKKTRKEKRKEKNKIKEEKTKNQKGMMNVAQTTQVDLSILSSAVRMSHANHAKMK